MTTPARLSRLALLGLFSLTLSPTFADSLWKRKTPDEREALWSSRRGMHVGDIVTVIIQETSESQEKEGISRKRKTSASGGLNYDLGPAGTDGGNLTFNTDRGINAEHSDETKKAFSTRLSGIIKEKLFNGNLLIEATRELIIADEVTTIILTGIIRPDDIRGDNTILSESIAEAQIRYEGKGNIGEVRKKGRFGSRILDFVIPF